MLQRPIRQLVNSKLAIRKADVGYMQDRWRKKRCNVKMKKRNKKREEDRKETLKGGGERKLCGRAVGERRQRKRGTVRGRSGKEGE